MLLQSFRETMKGYYQLQKLASMSVGLKKKKKITKDLICDSGCMNIYVSHVSRTHSSSLLHQESPFSWSFASIYHQSDDVCLI